MPGPPLKGRRHASVSWESGRSACEIGTLANPGSIEEVIRSGFFDALRRTLTHDTHKHVSHETQKRIRSAWGLDDEESPAPAPEPEGPGASAYDRSQWKKRLRHIFEALPASQKEWPVLMTDAHASALDPTGSCSRSGRSLRSWSPHRLPP